MPPLPKLPGLAPPAAPGHDPRDVQKATDALAIETTPQVSSINQAISQIQSYLDRDVSAQEKYGQIADEKISQIGSQLGETLQANVGKIGDIYSQGTKAVGGAYDEAAATMQGVGQNLQGGLQDLASRLGQEHTVTPGDEFSMNPMERLVAEGEVLKNRNATGKAGSVANLETLGTQMQSIAQKAVGDEERNTARKREDVANNVLKTISQLQMTSNESTSELMQKYADLASVAGPRFRQMLDAYAGARTEQEAAAAQQAFANSLEQARLAIDQEELRLRQESSSMDNYLKELEGLGMEQELMGIGAEEEDKGLTEAKGMHGLTAWMRGSGLGGHFKGGIRRLLADVTAQSMDDDEAYREAINQIVGGPKDRHGRSMLPDPSGARKYAVDPQNALAAIDIYFGKGGTAKSGKEGIPYGAAPQYTYKSPTSTPTAAKPSRKTNKAGFSAGENVWDLMGRGR